MMRQARGEGRENKEHSDLIYVVDPNALYFAILA